MVRSMIEIRKCIDCGLEQDITLFPIRKGRKPTHSDSYTKRCKACTNKKQNKNDRARRLRTREMKECPTCKEVKPMKQFKLGRRVLGYSDQCRDCIISQFREICQEDLKDTYSPIQRLSRVKKLYGLNPEEYIALMKNSHNCEICNALLEGKVKCIDHSHETGKNRGVLCPSCNLSLGKVRDNPETLLRAIDYLNKHNNLVLSSNGTSND